MNDPKKQIARILIILSLVICCGCNSYVSLDPLPDPPSSSVNDESSASMPEQMIGLHIFTYWTKPVYDSYSSTEKDVQISDFYPVDLTQKQERIRIKATITEQIFSDDSARFTNFFIADGQLCMIQQAETEIEAYTSPYRVGEEIDKEYTVELSNKNAPFTSITVCSDRNLPQTEPEWAEWSRKHFFVNSELLPSSNSSPDEKKLQRQNVSLTELQLQRFTVKSDEGMTILELSEKEVLNTDDAENWRLQMRNGQPLYLYCKAPSASCSLILLIDGAPVNVFDGKYAADLDNQPSAELWRIPVMLPDTLNGQHDAVLLLFDRMEQQMITGTPVILNCGGDT